MKLILNLNAKTDFIISDFAKLDKQRIISLVLPLLALNAHTAAFSSLASCAYSCYSLYSNTNKTKREKATQAALLLSSSLLGCYAPHLQLLFSSSFFFYSHVSKLFKGSNKALTLFQISNHALYLSSNCYKTPLLLATSLIFQAINELLQAYQEEKSPERCFNMLLAALRLYEASQYLPRKAPIAPTETVKAALSQDSAEKTTANSTEIAKAPPPRDSLKKITQKDWTLFTLKYPYYFQTSLTTERPLLNIRDALQKEGWSPLIEGLTFSHPFAYCQFENMKFENCTFQFGTFYQSFFENVCLKSCNIADVRWIKSTINHSQFIESSLVGNWFKNCKIENASLKGSAFNNSCMEECSIHNLLMQKVNLETTHWIYSLIDGLTIQQGNLNQSAFLSTSVKESSLIDCNLENALLLDAKERFTIEGGIPHKITKPIIALGWDYHEPKYYTCKIREALLDQGALVLAYPQAPEWYQCHLLPQISYQPTKSIAEQLLNNPLENRQIAAIKKEAATILHHVDGLVLPGGFDVDTYLYKPDPSIEKVAYRSLLEIALIAEASRQKICTLGICRGAQIINVFFGGTLRNVQDQSGTQLLEWVDSPLGEQIKTIFPKKFIGFSAHSQAADKIGRDLEVVLQYQKIPKLLMSKDGNFIACQFHPEVYTDLFSDCSHIFKSIDSIKKAHFPQIVSKIASKIIGSLDVLVENMPTKNTKQIMDILRRLWINLLKVLVTDLHTISSNRKLYKFFMDKVRSARAGSLIAVGS